MKFYFRHQQSINCFQKIALLENFVTKVKKFALYMQYISTYEA